MLALNAVKPITMFIACSSQKIVDAARICDHLKNGAAMIGVKRLARRGAQLVHPDTGVHRRKVLIEGGSIERPEIPSLFSARVSYADELASPERMRPATLAAITSRWISCSGSRFFPLRSTSNVSGIWLTPSPE